jgi:hypothetical protein
VSIEVALLQIAFGWHSRLESKEDFGSSLAAV